MFLRLPRSAWSHWFWSLCFADQPPPFPSPAWKFSRPCMAAWFGLHSDEAEIWASEIARLSIPRGSRHSSQKKRQRNRELNYQRTNVRTVRYLVWLWPYLDRAFLSSGTGKGGRWRWFWRPRLITPTLVIRFVNHNNYYKEQMKWNFYCFKCFNKYILSYLDNHRVPSS